MHMHQLSPKTDTQARAMARHIHANTGRVAPKTSDCSKQKEESVRGLDKAANEDAGPPYSNK